MVTLTEAVFQIYFQLSSKKLFLFTFKLQYCSLNRKTMVHPKESSAFKITGEMDSDWPRGINW